MELCGGTHVKRTSELGNFKIISELGISSGIRRIEALSGHSLFEYLNERNNIVNQLSDLLKANHNQLFERVSSIQLDLISKTKELKKIKSELAYFKYASLLTKVENIGPHPLIISQIDDLDGDLLQDAALNLTSKLGDYSAVIIGGIPNHKSKKILFVISLGTVLVEKGLHAGELVNDIAKICSGGGGGKNNIAQAGAKNIDKIQEAFSYAKNSILQFLKD